MSGFLSDARDDLKHAVRLFARQPGILLLTVVGLSLGLSIATSAFSIMNAAVLRGDGLLDPDRAPGVLRTTDRSLSTAWKYDEFLTLREGATRMQVEGILTDAAAARTRATEAPAPSVGVAFVSGGFFEATGGRVMLGRPLQPADERNVSPQPVVVSFVFWVTSLDRDPAVVGRTLWIGGTDATIVGVAERGFSVPNSAGLWMPLTAYGAVYEAPAQRTPEAGIQIFGRLSPDASLAEAEAQLGGVAAGIAEGAAGESAHGVRLDPHVGLGRMSASDALITTVFLFVMIALVLLLACANVSSVLIATAMAREREMGVRAALGATRARIIRQLVTESLALGAVAAAVGMVLTSWAIPIIGAMIEAPAGSDLSPDVGVYLFLAIMTLVAGVGAGLAPAWHGRGVDLLSPLKGEGASGRVAPRRLRSALVMAQTAVSVLLLVLATLFVRATFRARAIDVGFDAAGLYAVSPGFGEAVDDGGARARLFWSRAIPEVRAVPGVASAALVEMTPFGGMTRASIAGEGPSEIVAYFNRTSPEYFETIGLRILAGRTYTHDEAEGRAPVALVSRSLARAWWQGRSPLGELLPEEIKIPQIEGTPVRPVVVGVVDDAIAARLEERSPFAVYEPLDPAGEGSAQLMIRVVPGTAGAIRQVSQRLRSIDAAADVRIASISGRLLQETSRPRILAALTGAVGAIAMILCVVGLYGLTASVVGQRAREMAIRAAMGAQRRDLLRLLMWDSLRPVAFGIAVGAGAALLVSQVATATFFFGVSPRDPIAIAGAIAILIGAAMLAVVVPTRRAAAVDAAVVLKRP